MLARFARKSVLLLGLLACRDHMAEPVEVQEARLDVVRPFACGSGAAPVVFVGEAPPPATLSPGATFETSVTFANCGSSTWSAVATASPTGTKIGFAAPRDSATWGHGRVALPDDVPPSMQVTIALHLRAPNAPGDHGYAWAVVDEGVAWYAPESPLHSVRVGTGGPPPPPSGGTQPLCPGISVDTSGASPASSSIQSCIDGTPEGGALELPPGTYRVTSALRFDKPITLRTAGAQGAPACLVAGGPPCAVLRADPNLVVDRGFVRFGDTHHVGFDHVVIDGNRAARLGSSAAAQCAAGATGAGFNASSSNCTSCSFVLSASIHALCGTGFEWRGHGARVLGSIFRDNGDHTRSMMWADGLTVLWSNGAVIDHDHFSDNSDVDLIIGGATDASITSNVIRHGQQAAFAGLMLDNFNGTAPGDFRGTDVGGNDIQCNGMCDFGIELGPHAWYLSANILGGSVTGNSVQGGKIGINVEGAGTPAAPIVVTGNNVGSSPASAAFQCGTRPTTAFNVSPDSVVDLGGGPAPTGAMTFHSCP